MRTPRHCFGLFCVWGLVVAAGVGTWPAGRAVAQSVYVEDSPAAMELAERARQWRSQGRLSDAVSVLVSLSETYPGKLMPLGDGRYVDASWWVRRELTADEELRAVYERDAEPVAVRALAGALATDGGDGWYDAEALAEVGRRFWLTESGLSANLAWCSVMLERGEPAAALAVLEQLEAHPAAGRGTAARQMTLLREAAELMRSALAQAVREGGAGVGLPIERASLDGALWTAWWNDLVESSASMNQPSGDDGFGLVVQQGQRAVVRGNGGNRNNARAGLTRLNLQPGVVLEADTVWVSDGMSVASLDRASGRARWSRWWPGMLDEGDQALAALGQSLMDRRGVMVSGARVYAVLGPSRVSTPRNRRVGVQGMSGSGLWCMDREDGSVVWSVEPGDLDEAFEQAGFMGVPVEAGPGVLAVRMRRVQASGFVDAYVAGVDTATGKLRWSRHLASTSHPNGTGVMPPAVPMVAAGGRLFVDEGLGVAAALDPRDGGLWWLRKTVADTDDGKDGNDGPLDAVRDIFNGGNRVAARRALTAAVQGQTGPAVLDPGVMVSKLEANAQGRSVVSGGAWLLDPATGEVLREFEEEESPWVVGARWTAARSLGQAGPVDRLLVAGSRKLWCLDTETFDVLWADSAVIHQAGDHHAVPMVDDDQVLAVSGPTLRVFGMNGGTLRQTIAWPAGAAWSVGRGEMVSVTPQAVNGFVSVAQGERRLRRRIASTEGGESDPEPGLALASLGVSAERADLLLEGATAALQAVNSLDPTEGIATSLGDDEVTAMLNALNSNRNPTQEDEAEPDQWSPADPEEAAGRLAQNHADQSVSVVLELIELAAGAEAMAPEARRAVFDKVAASVAGPDELVAYHLALGPLEREANNPGDAAAHYQAVLRDDVLADRVVQVQGQPQRAGLAARQHLTSLIAEFGFAVYEPFETQARRELNRLSADALTRPDEFVSLADRYPLAEASAQALLLAASKYEQADNARRAVSPLRRAYRIARTEPTRATAVGRLASLYIAQSRFGTAQSWLERVAREFPSIDPIRDGVPISLSAWVAELQAVADASAALPAFDPLPLPGSWTVPGKLLDVAPNAQATHRRDHAVLWQDNRVSVIDLVERQSICTKVLPASDAVVLRFSDDQLVLFSAQRGEVYAIDTQGPNNLAVVPLRLETLLNSAGAPLSNNAPINDAGFEELEGLIENLNIRGNGRVVVNGRVVANGRQQQLQHFALATDTLVLLADSVGRVVALDRLTLKPQWTFRLPGASLTGITADEDTAVLFGLADANTNIQAGHVVALDLLTGQQRGQTIREQSQAPLHAQPMPDGTLLITFPTFIASYTLDTTLLRWRSPKPFDLNSPFIAPPIVSDGVLAVTFTPALPTPTVLMLDPASGQPYARITADLKRHVPAPPAQRFVMADGRLHVLSEQPACFADNGLLLWRSAIENAGLHGLHHALTAQHVLVLVQSDELMRNESNPELPPTRYRLDAYERDTGRLVAQHPLDLGEGSVITQLSQLYDHHLAYSSNTQTTFITDSP